MASAGTVEASGCAGTARTAIAALRRLGVDRSTGAFEISRPAQGGVGAPAGRVYLVNGGVVYAESTAVPGVDVRLARTGRTPPARWRSLARALSADRPEGDALVEVTHAAVSDAELDRIVRSATADAVVSLLRETGGVLYRFSPGLGRWSARARRTAVDDLLDEVAGGLRMLAASRIGPDDTISLAPARDDGVLLGRPLLAVLVGVTDGGTPRQAAWQSGTAVLDAVATLSDLFGQGAAHLHTAPEPPAPEPPRPAAPPGPPSETSPPSPAKPPAGPPRAPGEPGATGAPGQAGQEAASLPGRLQPESQPVPSAPQDHAPLPCRRRPQTVRPRSGHEPVVTTTDASILTRLIEGLRRE